MDTIAKPVYYRGGLRGWPGFPAAARSAWIGRFAMDRNRYSRVVSRLLALFAVALTVAVPASASWKEKVVYSFQGGTDGSLPAGSVIFDKVGNLYGATIEGGSTACPPGWCGTIYQLSPPTQKGGQWTETVLYVFKGHDQNDGSSPSGGLIADNAGNFYGVTGYGGSGPCVLFGTATGCGTVFELSPPAQKGGAWTETVLYNFRGGKDGDLPTGPLVFDSAGDLYGATEFGGGKGTTCDVFYGGNCGTVFKLSPPKTKGGKWTEKVLHRFAGISQGKQYGDGAVPNAGLVVDTTGAVYGTTSYGGNQQCKGDGYLGCGTVFKLALSLGNSASWAEAILHRFVGYPNDGQLPSSGLIFDSGGTLYGTTAGGGDQAEGTIFVLKQPKERGGPWRETLLHQFTAGSDGAVPIAPLTLSAVGALYGAASIGGVVGGGTLFQLTLSPKRHTWRFDAVYTFRGSPDGSYPASRLTLGPSRSYYGTTQQSGNAGQNCGRLGCGTVFEVSP
jgi:hypothetical protein